MLREVAITCFVASGLAGCVTQPSVDAPPTERIALDVAQQQAIQDGVRRSLKDPYSAVFGPMAASRDASGAIYVCGNVNSRNGFGGYVGFTPYFGVLAELPGGVRSFSVSGFGQTDIEAQTAYIMCKSYGVF